MNHPDGIARARCRCLDVKRALISVGVMFARPDTPSQVAPLSALTLTLKTPFMDEELGNLDSFFCDDSSCLYFDCLQTKYRCWKYLATTSPRMNNHWKCALAYGRIGIRSKDFPCSSFQEVSQSSASCIEV